MDGHSHQHGRISSGAAAGKRALLLVAIMFLGSLGLWIGAPLLGLWVGSQVQGATGSLGLAVGAALVAAVAAIVLLGLLLAELSSLHRSDRLAHRLPDPGHAQLERVLVISAGVALLAFAGWFFLFAGADPVPLGVQV
jgi:hypothetical protein